MTAAPSVAAGVALLEALRAGGVRHVVLSPGSRSAPLARAAAAAEARGDIELLVRVDERSAGFTALGVAKVTGAPVALICTSGTAGANLLPAVVEARYSGVPLVLVTADRPPELRGRGASQTIDQPDLFGHFVLGSRDLPTPSEEPWTGPELTLAAVRLAARARGPVHVNVPLRPPLMGTLPVPVRSVSPDQVGDTVVGSAGPVPDLGAMPSRGAILVGDIDVWDQEARAAIERLERDTGWPVVAEASSGLLGRPGVVPGGTATLNLAGSAQTLRADLVLTVGPFGLDRGVLDWVSTARRHVAVRLRPRTDPPDPLTTAEVILDAVPTATATRSATWDALWQNCPAPEPEADTIAALAAQVWASMSAHDLLLVASSTSIRALAAAARGPGPQVLANRGANGIDGLVSTAYGAARAWTRGRTVALLGDLAFLHDSNGLLVPGDEPAPDLTLVVADNNGGAIFGTLEQGAPEFADTFERVFGTPHGRDLAALGAAHGVPSLASSEASVIARELRRPSSGVRALIATGLSR